MVGSYNRLCEKEDIVTHRKALQSINTDLRVRSRKIKYYDNPVNAYFEIANNLYTLDRKLKALNDLKDYMQEFDKNYSTP